MVASSSSPSFSFSPTGFSRRGPILSILTRLAPMFLKRPDTLNHFAGQYRSLSSASIKSLPIGLTNPCSDPWWIFTSLQLFLVIKNNYDLTILQLLRASPRFGILLFCMLVSIVFLVTDIVITARVSTQSGINPYWRVSLFSNYLCSSWSSHHSLSHFDHTCGHHESVRSPCPN